MSEKVDFCTQLHEDVAALCTTCDSELFYIFCFYYYVLLYYYKFLNDHLCKGYKNVGK